MTGATVAASSQCVFSVTVTGATAGTKVTTTSQVTSVEGGNGNNATATLTVGLVATTTNLTSSRNPSSFGEPVTFTATVTSAGSTPTGSVSFLDSSTVLGTVTLSSDIAAFTISTLPTGNHSITASYSPGSGFAASTSAVLIQSVNTPTDSLRFRALQILVTPTEAQVSGQAFSGAVQSAVGEASAEAARWLRQRRAESGSILLPIPMIRRGPSRRLAPAIHSAAPMDRSCRANVDRLLPDRGMTMPWQRSPTLHRPKRQLG
jgi:hypothetical protein